MCFGFSLYFCILMPLFLPPPVLSFWVIPSFFLFCASFLFFPVVLYHYACLEDIYTQIFFFLFSSSNSSFICQLLEWLSKEWMREVC